MTSMQSFLGVSAVRKPLSALRRRGEKYTLRNSERGARGETISVDYNGEKKVRNLEQWLLAEGRAVDETTMQALRKVPPELALTIIDGLWSAFTKEQNQEGVDANSLVAGQTIPGSIHFGGASINMGEGLQLHIPALDLKASALIGPDQKMDVRVEEIQGAGKKDVAPNAPTLSVDAIRVGQQLRGVVKRLPHFGGAFMCVGADRDVYMPRFVLPEDTQVGEEMDVWVTRKQAHRVGVSPISPKVDISSLALGEKLHGVIKTLPEFGGAFLDVGAVSEVYLNAVDLADDAKAGDELEVWVREIKEDGKVVVMSTAPKMDIGSLALGDKLQGVVRKLPKFGGAFLDIGAVRDVYIPQEDLTVGAKAGDEMEVWVKIINDIGKVQVTPTAPKVDIRSLAVGDKLHGVIMPLPKFGGVFVDVGAITHFYIPAFALTEEVEAGAEADVWVKRIRDGGKVQVTLQAPEAHSS